MFFQKKRIFNLGKAKLHCSRDICKISDKMDICKSTHMQSLKSLVKIALWININKIFCWSLKSVVESVFTWEFHWKQQKQTDLPFQDNRQRFGVWTMASTDLVYLSLLLLKDHTLQNKRTLRNRSRLPRRKTRRRVSVRPRQHCAKRKLLT